MSNTFRVVDYDIIYLSYDEPNAEQNYADLLTKAPWAERVHGVKGSDSAHKAAAEKAKTDRFITIDGDNRIRDDFLSQVINFDENLDLTNKVISWTAKNKINGLMYGNGGIKCWPKAHVLNMRTHENADPDNPHAQVDFCWDTEYVQMNGTFSDIYNNATPKQAWRAGFREGVKMTLADGDVVDKHVIKKLNRSNYKRLLTWMSVGADAENGLWAIYGARLGCVMTNLRRNEWDWKNVRDFDWLTKYFNEEIAYQFAGGDMMCTRTGFEWDSAKLWKATVDLGKEIRREFDLEIADLDTNGSRFFKTAYVNPSRLGAMVKEDQVINGIDK